MPISKLESLPNEILVHIFEKYINGVDILTTFLYQQNRRFDALISQCTRFNFSFLNCRKDDFRLCIGLLPAYVERIEQLVLSDENTPGQIYAFLSLFRSFTAFKRLRKLYFHYNAEAVEYSAVQNAFQTLSNTNVDTISIKAMNIRGVESMNPVIAHILRLPTIKRFFFLKDLYRNSRTRDSYISRNRWEFMTRITSKIEYLTILGTTGGHYILRFISQCAPQLKYLNVGIHPRTFNEYDDPVAFSSSSIKSVLTLHTLKLSFEENDSTTFDMLTSFFKAMPLLRRLEIKANRALLDPSAWESLLQTSLPLLTHFILRTTTSCIRETDIDTILMSFETPFWISKQNFYVVLTRHQKLDHNRFGMHETQINQRHEFNQPVVTWWIAPVRSGVDDTPTNGITSIVMSDEISSLSPYNHFNNVENLIVYNLNTERPEWLVTFLNSSQIRYLDISSLINESVAIASLLSCVHEITSLRIRYDELLTLPNAYLGRASNLKYLDTAVEEHSFVEGDIVTISTMFPNMKHLAINTKDLSNIPLLGTYLPGLISLTYKIIDGERILYSSYEQKKWDYQLREKVQFLFQRNENWLTIWVDGDALKDSYWQIFPSNPARPKRTRGLLERWFARRSTDSA